MELLLYNEWYDKIGGVYVLTGVWSQDIREDSGWVNDFHVLRGGRSR